MGDLNSSTFTQPWQVSILYSNGTDLNSKFAPPWIHSAWSLKSELQKIQKRQKSLISSPDDDFEINLQYAYFIVMGGVRFDVNDILSTSDLDPSAKKIFKDPQPEKGQRPVRRTVRAGPPAIVQLASKGHWFKVPEKDIDDKSKAGVFQKALVLIQILWMITQCVCRFVFGLPLTLLEIHTMLHVFFAIIQYCCWVKVRVSLKISLLLADKRTKTFGSSGTIRCSTTWFRSRTGHDVTEAVLYQDVIQSSTLPFPSNTRTATPEGSLGRQMRWIDPASTEMKVGDILPSGLAFYTVNTKDALFPLENIWGGQTMVKHKLNRRSKPVKDSFPLTPEFFRRWGIILSKYSNEQREYLAETSMKIRQHRCEEDGIPDLPEREKRILLLVRLDEFRQELILNCERDFWEGRSFFSLDLAPHYETQGFLSKYGPMWKFWRYHKIVFLAAILSICYGGLHLAPTFLLKFPSYTEAA
ncbi:hypothetical protein FNYG_00405 [Fusarium nygamai]|uniref:Uncharacterized protein n=1 Tax=Gibberella nygamai TaxID=42673 RepID=A0A2K0WV80_GIBNY|nr:hypothetical protein FNYG_00405 [Fusarium nygamai]